MLGHGFNCTHCQRGDLVAPAARKIAFHCVSRDRHDNAFPRSGSGPAPSRHSPESRRSPIPVGKADSALIPTHSFQPFAPMRARVAIVSAAGTGRKRLLPALRSSKTAEVVAIHTRDRTAGAALAAEYQIPASYDDAAVMLDSTLPDLVIIASPPFLHQDHVALAARRGIPILCEKPLAHNLAATRAIQLCVTSAGIPFAVAHHVRHQPAVAYVREVLASGLLGSVHHVHVEWSFLLNPAGRNAAWKLDPGAGGLTAFYDAGVHAIDLLIHLFGRPTAVAAAGIRHDEGRTYQDVAAIFSYHDFLATVTASQKVPYPANPLIVDGERGRLTALHALSEQSIERITMTTADGVVSHNFEPVDLYRAEIEDFVATLRRGATSPATTLAEAVDAMEILASLDALIRRPKTSIP